MDNKLHQEAVKKAVKKKFKGKKAIGSRAVPKYPSTADREFQRVTNGYMRLLNSSLKEHLPAIMAAYKRERHGDSRYDDALDLEDEVRRELQEVAEELEQKIAKYGLEGMVERIAKTTRNTSLREWKRAVKSTLGIDLLDDYYKGEYYDRALRLWVDQNVLKIKSIPNNTLASMRQIILDGFRNGRTIRDIQNDIQEEYNVTKHKAAMLARDQVSSLNAELSKQQQQDAGCTKYRWSTSKDSRVRDCHAELDGEIISWDDPPEMWYETKKYGIVYTGRKCHPGEDYCCRCVAIPVFDWETVDLPMKQDADDGE